MQSRNNKQVLSWNRIEQLRKHLSQCGRPRATEKKKMEVLGSGSGNTYSQCFNIRFPI